MPGGRDDRGGPSSRALMHARVRRDVAARPVLRGDCGGQQPQPAADPDPGLAIRHRQDPAAGLPGGPAMPSAVTACAWRLLTGTGYTPGPPPGTDAVHGAPGPGHPPPARRRPPCHTDRAAASRSPRSPPASRPADRTLMPESPLTKTAASPHGRPGRAPDLRTPGRPRPPCTPGHRTARVTTAISAPSRGRTGCMPRSAAAVEPPAGRPGSPSVAVREKADGAHRPSWRPDAVRYMSVDTATQGPTALQADTRRDKKETARIAENPQLPGRFRRWWQVLGSNQRRLSRRFYSPLLPAPPHGP